MNNCWFAGWSPLYFQAVQTRHPKLSQIQCQQHDAAGAKHRLPDWLQHWGSVSKETTISVLQGLLWGPLLFSLHLFPLRHFMLMTCYADFIILATFLRTPWISFKTENTISSCVLMKQLLYLLHWQNCMLVLKTWTIQLSGFSLHQGHLIRLLLRSILSLVPFRIQTLNPSHRGMV